MKTLTPREKAKLIKLLLLDVDGVLTDGKLYFTSEGVEYKAFHSQDGLGIKMLQQANIQVGVITARHSNIVQRRMDELGVLHVFQGQNDKLKTYEEVKSLLNLEDAEIAYMGDDLIDIGPMQRAGLGIAVANATHFVQQRSDWTTERRGGWGAVREACEFILSSQNKLEAICERYLAATEDSL